MDFLKTPYHFLKKCTKTMFFAEEIKERGLALAKWQLTTKKKLSIMKILNRYIKGGTLL